MLPHLSEEQIDELANRLESEFPKTPPGNHVNVGALVRFIYGVFEKKGALRSNEDFKRMKKEKLDWDLPIKFIDLLYKKMEKNNNYYGLTILCEMKAHRLGDKAVIHKDEDKLDDMELLYCKAVKYGSRCNSYKHMFTPYYWAFRYFEKWGNVDKAISYAFMTFVQADLYCPDARPGYITKLKDCFKCIEKHKDKKEVSSFVKKYKNSKNKCVRKLFGK